MMANSRCAVTTTENTRNTVMTASRVRTAALPECNRKIIRDCTKMKNAVDTTKGEDAPNWPEA
jgi:hypothetical protein